MNSWRTFIVILTVAATSGSAFATAFVWDGDTDDVWETAANWDQNAGAPGDNAADTALINDSNNGPVVYGNAAGNRTIATLSLSAETKDEAVTLDLTGDDTLTVTGTSTVTAAIDAAVDATLKLNGASMSFDPSHLVLVGGDPAVTNGRAIFDYNAGTFTSISTDMLTMRGESLVDAEQNLTIAGLFEVDPAASSFGAQARVDMLTDKTFTAGSMDVDATNDQARFEQFGDGSMVITNAITIMSGLSNGRHATFRVFSSAGDVTFGSLAMVGDAVGNSNATAKLDLDRDINESTKDVTVEEQAEIDVASSKTFTIDDLTVGDDTAGYDGDLDVLGTGTLDIDGTLIIEGDVNGSSLSVSGTGTVVKTI